MRRSLAWSFVLAVGLSVSTVGFCCSSCEQRLRETFTGVEPARLKGTDTQIVIDSFELNPSDVPKFIKDMPVLREEFEEVVEFEHGPLNADPFLIVLTNDSLRDRLKALGWDPPERFFLVMNKIKEVYPYLWEDDPEIDNRVLEHNLGVVQPYKEDLEQLFHGNPRSGDLGWTGNYQYPGPGRVFQPAETFHPLRPGQVF